MSSATAPARERGPADRTDDVLALALRLARHDLLPARLRHRGPRRLRADHGAVGLLDRRPSATPSSAYSIFLKQAAFAVVGLRRPRRRLAAAGEGLAALALPLLALGIVLQLLVLTPLGHAVNGNQNWLKLGPITVQPSEVIKLGLVLSGGLILSAKRKALALVRPRARALPRPPRRREHRRGGPRATTSAP